MVEVQHISKSYGEVKAISDLSFHVEKGELFGLIGPDGAGKTTLFRIITTLLLADEGKASVCGYDVVNDFKKIRRIIGYMPGRFSLYQDLSVEENLEFFATVFGTTIQENYHLIKDIYAQIEPFKKRKAGKLSGGMKQKLALSCALIHKPEVLILDEPTTGVDAVSRKEFWHMLKNLKAQGISILVSTPYMDEASMCDRVALIQKGKIMDIDTPEAITGRYSSVIYAVKSDSMYNLIQDLRNFSNTNKVNAFGEYLHLSTLTDTDILAEVTEYLMQKGHTQIEIKPIEPNIEDCFMELMTRQDMESHKNLKV